MDELELRDPHLDDLVRSAFVVEPPAEVQQSILAAVLQAAEPPLLPPVAVGRLADARPVDAPTPAATMSPLVYLLLGAVLLAYVGVVSWVQGMLGDPGWLSTLVRQVVVAVDLLAGQSFSVDPLTLASMLVQAAPWLVLLPLAWLLWERDRASASAG